MLFAAAAPGAPPSGHASGYPEAFIERGMPRAALREFKSLPPADRAGSPLIPKLIRRLADAGRDDLALSLFAEEKASLREPVRSEAFLEAGEILWRQGRHEKAAEAFREVAGESAAARRAASYLARFDAATENAQAANQALSRLPESLEKDIVSGEIEIARGNLEGAAAAWGDALPGSAAFPAAALSLSRAGSFPAEVDELKAAADNTSAGNHAERAALLEALASASLAAKDYEGALSAARDSLDAHERWKSAVARYFSWDGTRDGAYQAWESLCALFPYEEDSGSFRSSGRRFLSAAALHETHLETEAGNAELSLRVGAAKEGISTYRKRLAGSLRRAEEIVKSALRGKAGAEGMRERLRMAAVSLPLAGWGAKADPRGAALLEDVDRRLREFGDRIAVAGEAADAAAGKKQGAILQPEDRRMLFFARHRIARLTDSLHALEGRASLLKAAVRNSWKAAYVAQLSRQMDKAENAVKNLSDLASKAEKTFPRFREALVEAAVWETALDRYRSRLADGSSALSRLRAEAKAASSRELAGIGRELKDAIARSERHTCYIAARAATGRHVEERRPDLRAEAIRHWEAALPLPGERNAFGDEALYALGELRFEEAESGYLQKEEAPGGNPDFSVPISLFRKLIEDHPGSPYREQALYGLALSFQEAGSADNAVSSMKELLARHPGTRFADELHLRLGEYAFDESDYRKAEEAYGKVSAGAPPEIRVTALFKLGWSRFLQGRPKESTDPFLSAMLLSRTARRTGGVPKEALAMAARSLVESSMEREAESLLARRDGSEQGPALLLQVQNVLETQNRYAEAAGIADRIANSYPMASERIDAEIAASEALRKAGKEEDGNARKGRFHRIFGPGSAWRAHSGRSPADAERADSASEEAMRGAAFFFHARSRQAPPGDRVAILALYDAYLSTYPSSPKADEVAYQRAWLLFEDGRKREAAAAFEKAALRPGGTRGEASWYMAVQSSKDMSSLSDAASQAEIVRLAREYGRLFPRGERIFIVSMDRARAHADLRQFALAAETAETASGVAGTPGEVRASLRLVGEARFEMEDFAAAEKAFRALLTSSPPAEEARDAGKWVAFSTFRRAEMIQRDNPAEAAELFGSVNREFPLMEIAPVARFRAGTAYAAAGKNREAIAALLTVESTGGDSAMSLDASRWLARLYEKTGNPAAAGERYERLATAGSQAGEEMIRNMLRAADLYSAGKEEARARKSLHAVASMPGVTPELRVQCLFRAGESARTESRHKEADRYYEETVAAHAASPEAAPAVAGKALFLRAEYRLPGYREISIAPPLEKTFRAKQAALEECAKFYVEAIRFGDAQTVSASLHRLGEAFEDFRSAILSSPPPRGLSGREREEYAFLLEEKAAPIEDRAVEAYLRNLRQAVGADYRSEWVDKSLQRLKTLRPARFVKKGQYAIPVLTVPAFLGVMERGAP